MDLHLPDDYLVILDLRLNIHITRADLEALHSNTEESKLFYKRKQCILLYTQSVILPYF